MGGGIWWHEGHKDGSKNACSNAPAAVACLAVARHARPGRAGRLVGEARRIVDWTVQTLELDDGLFADRAFVATGELNRDRLTYNTGLMIRAFLGLYRATGDAEYLGRAGRAAAASDWFLDARTHAYRDAVKWSHLLVEADLELYRATGGCEAAWPRNRHGGRRLSPLAGDAADGGDRRRGDGADAVAASPRLTPGRAERSGTAWTAPPTAFGPPRRCDQMGRRGRQVRSFKGRAE